jgi:hypothetical protein
MCPLFKLPVSKIGNGLSVLLILLLLQAGVGFAQTGITLDRYWDSPAPADAAITKDLATLLSPFAKPALNLAPSPNLEIYSGVTYLMPLEEAKTKLNLPPKSAPKAPVTGGSFPKNSFFQYSFDGTFEGQYNKLQLVTDTADQVIAIQLVAESPKRDQVDAPYDPPDWRAYNFISSRSKASTKLWVSNTAWYPTKTGTWLKYRPASTSTTLISAAAVLRIDSLFMDPDCRRGYSYRGSNWKALEAARLYLPKPLAELILHRVQKAR